jgi:hypothetical protein
LAAHDDPFQPVPFTAVHLTDDFWAPRLETNRLTTIPYAFGKCAESGRMDNFERAAAVLRGENISDRKPPGFPFDDSRVVEWCAMEGLNLRPLPCQSQGRS